MSPPHTGSTSPNTPRVAGDARCADRAPDGQQVQRPGAGLLRGAGHAERTAPAGGSVLRGDDGFDVLRRHVRRSGPHADSRTEDEQRMTSLGHHTYPCHAADATSPDEFCAPSQREFPVRTTRVRRLVMSRHHAINTLHATDVCTSPNRVRRVIIDGEVGCAARSMVYGRSSPALGECSMVFTTAARGDGGFASPVPPADRLSPRTRRHRSLVQFTVPIGPCGPPGLGAAVAEGAGSRVPVTGIPAFSQAWTAASTGVWAWSTWARSPCRGSDVITNGIAASRSSPKGRPGRRTRNRRSSPGTRTPASWG